ncbi:MAG: spore coat protein [Actinobacteria bacterium]|nr:spore coat protein [Actinomycetota bacterium]
MQVGTREAMEMFEVIRDSVCIIDQFTDYISHCQDPALRQILENQQRHLVEEYSHKVSVMQGHGLDLTNLPRIQTPAGQQGTAASGMQGSSNIQFGMQQSGQGQTAMGKANVGQGTMGQTTMGQGTTRTITDRTIAQGALLLHKCGAVRATNSALESSEPHLRSLLANSARTCTDMAYEIFQYMAQRGLYQLPENPANFVNHMAQGQGVRNYQAQPQNLAGMQQNYTGTQQNLQTGMQGGIPRQFS